MMLTWTLVAWLPLSCPRFRPELYRWTAVLHQSKASALISNGEGPRALAVLQAGIAHCEAAQRSQGHAAALAVQDVHILLQLSALQLHLTSGNAEGFMQAEAAVAPLIDSLHSPSVGGASYAPGFPATTKLHLRLLQVNALQRWGERRCIAMQARALYDARMHCVPQWRRQV